MIVLEVVGVIVLVALLIAATAAMGLGMLGLVGVVKFVRCTHCGRLGVTSFKEPMPSCVQCRHSHLLHPVQDWHAAQPGNHAQRV